MSDSFASFYVNAPIDEENPSIFYFKINQMTEDEIQNEEEEKLDENQLDQLDSNEGSHKAKKATAINAYKVQLFEF